MNKKPIIVIAAIIILLFVMFLSIEKPYKLVVSSTIVESSIKSDIPRVKVFIENSGSMDGYMCNGSQLKDAVYDYVSDLNRHTDTTELYYINSQIIPYRGNLTSYIKDLNPMSFRIAGGNTANTDLGSIIATILNTIDDTTISIFISDCILDLPSRDTQRFLTNCEIRIKDEIINAQKRIPNLGVEIMKLSSDFSGRYFYPNGLVETLTDVKRPYYIWIFGDRDYLAKLNSVVPISGLVKYDLSGIVAFTNKSTIPFEIKNNALTNRTITAIKDKYHAIILADFRSTLQPDEMVQDKNNYTFHNPTITVDGVYPISDKKSNYTHFIKFTIPKGTTITQDCLTFNTPKMPSWVSESNDETGENIKENLSKTTGIKYLIQGVADAYKNEKIITEFSFNVKRK